ncbi:MAG: isoprenylcysteine carboxylmethyltransferase family protein [Pseudomonadota bacterium]
MRLLIPPPVQALICAGLIWFLSGMLPQLAFEFPWQERVAIALVALGLAIDFSSIRLFVRADTTINPYTPDKSETLVTNGIYKYTRNPMYVGMVIFLTAFGLWIGNWMFLPLTGLFIWYITKFQIVPEEEVLQEKFGDDYSEYRHKVRRWI